MPDGFRLRELERWANRLHLAGRFPRWEPGPACLSAGKSVSSRRTDAPARRVCITLGTASVSLYHRIDENADAVDRDSDQIVRIERELVGWNDSRARQEDHTV